MGNKQKKISKILKLILKLIFRLIFQLNNIHNKVFI